jgi:hypothetical protein
MAPEQLTEVFGSQHDVAARVRTHLFIVCPNNSGSTYLKNAFRSSRHTWNLAREGQRTFGFVGPRGRDKNRQLIWAGRPEWVDEYRAHENFDWTITKRAWYLQAVANDPAATVFVEKSPPFLLMPEVLAANFRDARFVLMVRDPYAAYEGIIRRRVPNAPDVDEDPRVIAAQHLMAAFAHQLRNRAELAECSVFFTYEELCADPERCAALVMDLAPAIDDLDLDQEILVKGIYEEPLRDMNEQQIARLTPEDLAIATRVFAPHAAMLAEFGYDLR